MARVVAEATRPGPSGPVTARVVRQPRDQIGHWVTPPSMRGHPCPHACCKNRQAHPDKLPVRLDRDYLRSLSEEDIEKELARYYRYRDDSPRGEAGFRAVAAEVDRRDARRAAAERRRQREQDYHDEVYREWLAAENGIQGGVLLNKKGINERSLFTGPQSRVDQYASDELKEWFASHPRPTRARIMGKASARRETMYARYG